MNKNALWVEKYRPKTFDDYIFQNEEHKKSFLRMVEDKCIPNLLLSGSAGTGKTTIARLLISSLGLDESDLLVINASDENNVETVREKIKNFVTSFGFNQYKVIHLEEADYITPAGQAILRSLMEDYTDVSRFILSMNYEHKIIPAIRSRCQTFNFKGMKKNDVVAYAAKILISENIKFELDDLDVIVDSAYPDIRKVINCLQQNSYDGTLHNITKVSSTSDYKTELLELMQTDKWDKIRELLCLNVSAEEWEGVYRFLYENLSKCNKFKNKKIWEEGILIIADHLHKNSFVSDQEINAAAMFIRLNQVGE